MNLDPRYSHASTDYIRLYKVAAVEPPDYKPGNSTTYPVGKFNSTDESLPVGYFLEGWLVSKPVVGGRVEVLRVSRNGVPGLGYFTSSEVVELESDGFRTRNSLYILTLIRPGPTNQVL